MNSNDTNHIVSTFDHDWREAFALLNLRTHPLKGGFFALTNGQEIESSLGEHNKLSKVDRIGTFTEYLTLGTTLSAMFEETVGILEGFTLRNNGP